jgi:uncharacterized protein (DUF58 family)
LSPAENRREKPRSDGVGLTRAGVWYLFFVVVLGLAAANTGNNGLYLVLAVMLGALAVSYVAGAVNVRGLRVRLRPAEEIFARRPTVFTFEVRNGSWFSPSWLLLLTLEPEDVDPPPGPPRCSTPWLVPFLPRRGAATGRLETTLQRRGRRRIRHVHLTSFFPIGVFRKGRRCPVGLEILVYPELFAPFTSLPVRSAKRGEEPTRRAGWGHELLGLRDYRQGDDPRRIHWKHSAKTGNLVYQEHETEESRRLLILLDNAVDPLDEARSRIFERRVSEAATAAVDFLDNGYEVALRTRDQHLPFAGGRHQRLLILEALALVEALGEQGETAPPLVPPDVEPYLHLTLDAPPLPPPAVRGEAA